MIDLQRTIKGKEMCLLCPNVCILDEGETGECGVRTNKHGNIGLDTYGMVSAMAVEPIEKKPITNYLPGTKTLSIGSYGCSLKCKFCENHKISQNIVPAKVMNPEEIVKTALEHECKSVCMTYNEPTIAYEFLLDLANEAHLKGMAFILKTNGYINKNPWEEICYVVDAMNIDWKGNIDSYINMTGANCDVVFDRIIEAHARHVHVEISIPIHDNMEQKHLFKLGKRLFDVGMSDIPCHLLKIQSAYHHYNTTSEDKMEACEDTLSKYVDDISVN